MDTVTRLTLQLESDRERIEDFQKASAGKASQDAEKYDSVWLLLLAMGYRLGSSDAVVGRWHGNGIEPLSILSPMQFNPRKQRVRISGGKA